MEQQKVKDDIAYHLTEEAEEVDEDLVGGLHRRYSRPIDKNPHTPFTVAAGLVSASSNISTITNEDQEPEPVQEQGNLLGTYEDFQVNAGGLVSIAGPGGGDTTEAAGAGDGAGRGGNGVGEEELLQAGSQPWNEEAFPVLQTFEEPSRELREAESGDFGVTAFKTDLIYEEYDQTIEKPNGHEDLITDFHEIRDDGIGISTSWRAPIDDDSSLVRLSSPKKSYEDEIAVSLIEEVESDDTEYNVKEVLEKQNTHDLYCPKCKHCITRKVILVRKRRKRIIRRGEKKRVIDEPKKKVTEPVSDDAERNRDGEVSPVIPVDDPEEDHRDDRQLECFRCLACLTCFIPSGDGFKLFPCFGKSGQATNEPYTPGVTAATDTENSCFSFLLWKKKPQTPGGADTPEEPSEIKTDQKEDSVEDIVPSKPLPGDNNVISEPKKGEERSKDFSSDDDVISEPKKDEERSKDISSQDAAKNLKKPQISIITGQFNTDPSVPVRLPAKNLDTSPKDMARRPKEPLRVITGFFDTSSATMKKDPSVKKDYSKGGEVSSPSDSQPSTPAYVNGGVVKEPEEEPIKSSNGDAIIMVREPHETTSRNNPMQDVENQPQPVTQPLLDQRIGTEVPELRDFDILKSIVYGGLVESIASLGVVSSAAGGGAATLNTVALALANLIGGLIVLIHNLIELKNEQSRGAIAQTDLEEDRYYQQLGQRGKFPLHATVAIVSYLVFGLVAPITYAFSFRKSDDVDYKLLSVAAASLFCILFLALGKAHVRSKSYVKMAFSYLTMGVAASGISFVIGVLIDKLLEKLGLFDSGSSSTSFSGMSSLGSGWASH